MYASTCWGLLGLAVTFALAVLGLPNQYDWLVPWFIGAAVACGGSSLICFAWPLRQEANRAKVAALFVHPVRALRLIEPSHVITLGLLIALGGVIWQWRRAPTPDPRIAHLEQRLADLQSKPGAAPQVATQVSIEAVKIPAPYYTRTDIERILEALFQTSDLLSKKGAPLRESADTFLRNWNLILLNKGEPEFRSEAKKLRVQIEAFNTETWVIINNNQHYVNEIAPVFGDRAPLQRFLERLSVLVQAGEKLPPNFDAKTLELLVPKRTDLGTAFEDFGKWMSDTFDRAAQETKKFRAMSQKAGK